MVIKSNDCKYPPGFSDFYLYKMLKTEYISLHLKIMLYFVLVITLGCNGAKIFLKNTFV